MKKPDIYKVDLKNMASDSVVLEYQMDDAFFSDVEASGIQKGNVHGIVDVKKTSLGSFRMDFHLQGTVNVPCDRCLDDIELPVSSSNVLFVKLGDAYSEDENGVVIPENDGCIDMSWFLYEFVALDIPLKHVHGPGRCNKQMMEKLGEYLSASSEDDDVFPSLTENKTDIDPRWNDLKKVIDK